MKYIFYIILFSFIQINAQIFEREISTIDFFKNNKLLENIFYGGVNNPEFQFIDINGDTNSDLFILSSDGTFISYINDNNNLLYNDNYFSELKISNWFFFVDIDNDDDYDCFTGAENNQLSYWENIGDKFNPNFRLQLEPVLDDNNEPIFSESVSNPVFVDIDNDNDFDLISGNQAGTVTFYENIGTADSFLFKFITNNWNDILIVGTKQNQIQKHGASSLEFGDIDSDNDFDILWGDFFSNSLYFLENEGTPENPDLNLKSNIFPVNSDSINTPGFNMPRLFDINKDGTLELFVSVLYEASIDETIIYYERIDSNPLSGYKLLTKDFLYSLDIGSKSIPAFVDIDADGDKDLFIGSEKNPNGTLYFFENEGDNFSPEFIFKDSLFSNIQSSLSIAPAFVDIDFDGDYDLLIGRFLGEIDIYINEGTNQSYSFSQPNTLKDDLGNNIKFSNFVRPVLIDIDNDDDLDLVLGGFNGRLQLYRNNGSKFNYSFEKDDTYFEEIDVGEQSAPAFSDIDNDGELELLIGNRDGDLKLFKKENGNYVLKDEKFLSNFGGDSFPSLVDIDSDGDEDLFIGNIKGGIYFYRNKLITKVEYSNSINHKNEVGISNYPNPFNNSTIINLQLEKSGMYNLAVYNILGERLKTIYDGFIEAGVKSFYFAPSEISSGNYFIVLLNHNQQLFVHPVIYLK